ncbi:peptidase A24A prepilin type IV [Paenibacillus vortex V453]|uniref:Peptidase A24 n=2 Tax=Paenibacillus TaxID=44249 RepID=A0A163FW68_9BACL|nr:MULTISPECIES: A24 family peptidase [Paenibacillus]EFU38806.1 peptidase A24A prepilin type IV [Paenibacillus vortex V453]KZS44590.1 peptidase A24 [Paenibacillus glucanolyticus]
MAVAYGLCAVYLITAFLTDLRSMKIPNALTVPAMLLGPVYHGILDGWEGMFFSLKGLGAGFLILLIMYFIGAVGAGDVKLFGGIGAWTGLWFTLHAIMYSVLCAGVVGLIILLWRRETMKRIRKVVGSIAGVFILKSGLPWRNNQEEHLRFPFMIAVLPGVISTYIVLHM